MKQGWWSIGGKFSEEWVKPKDERHRVGAPAVYEVLGGFEETVEWCRLNKYHREDGPAFRYFDTYRKTRGGVTWYYLHGKLHRIEGPCGFWSKNDTSGANAWYLEGECYDGPRAPWQRRGRRLRWLCVNAFTAV